MWQQKAQEGLSEARCRVMILGIGRAGNNVVNRLVEDDVIGVECVAVNTDLRDLNSESRARKVLIGENVTRGLSTNGNPEIGRAAAEESRTAIERLLENADVVFIVAGLGGGTGTGAAPIVADIARQKGAVVVGVVTTPFRVKKGRIARAVWALNEMRRACDTVVVIDNKKLMKMVPQLPVAEAFKVADQMLANMIKGIVETILSPSLINFDFADFRTMIKNGGVAVVGVGESDTSDRAETATRKALMTPLLDVDYIGAKGALVHVSGDPKMTVEEANRVGEIVTEMLGENASVIWGAQINPNSQGAMKVTLVLTGVSSSYTLSRFVNIMPELHNMETSFSEPEKSLQIDFGLDQIENFED